MSNFDLSDWVKQLGIKHFRGVYSRDNLPEYINKKECGIINLDSQIGPGTHWAAYRNIDDYHCEYFDSFGLIMPSEIRTYLSKSGKLVLYSGDEIQERDSVLCGYWCLYYLQERQKGVPMLNVIHNANFDTKDKSVNHSFITNYFKQQGGENPLGKAFEAAKWAEKITRKVILSTDHVFDRYWSGDIVKNAFTGPTGITSKKFWTKPKKGTVMMLVKNPKTGQYENV